MRTKFKHALLYRVASAFHQACDQADFEIATQLLRVMEAAVKLRPSGCQTNKRQELESVVAAHERLWHLQRDFRLAA